MTAHLWLVDPERPNGDPCDLSLVLGDDEKQRLGRYVFARDRRLFLVAHALARLALSWCERDVAPTEWVFERGPHGRPEIARPAHTPWRFSISHTPGLVACLKTDGADCGVDVEGEPGNELRAMIAHVLSPREQAVVTALPERQRTRAVLQHWVLKEAYAKARGLGLALPFHTCEVALNPPRLLAADGERDAADWRLELLETDTRILVASAVRFPLDGPSCGPHRRALSWPPIGAARCFTSTKREPREAPYN